MTDWDEVVGRALEEAARAGVGRGAKAPGWMRARARAALVALAERRRCEPAAMAASLGADPTSLEAFAQALRVGETRFYRDPRLWRALEGVLPGLRPGQSLRVLSAGCSTGEEAYTAAMLLAVIGRPGTVLGIDSDREALAVAQVGRYPLDATRDLPEPWARRYLRATGTGAAAHAAIAPSIASRVEFGRHDVVRQAPAGAYDLVLFRNVLVYLSAEAGARALRQLARALSPGGLLFVAASEVALCRGSAGLAAVKAGGVTGFVRAGSGG